MGCIDFFFWSYLSAVILFDCLVVFRTWDLGRLHFSLDFSLVRCVTHAICRGICLYSVLSREELLNFKDIRQMFLVSCF